jgi:hypothetical protein
MADQANAQSENWQEFEKLAAKIQQELAPKAHVERNAKLLGKRSGIERQIDILIDETVAQYKIRVVIDCKDYQAPVDVKGVEEFIGLIEDVGANKGAMISARGFTEIAKKRAKDAGIDVYRLIDTASTKWSAYISLPCVITDQMIESFSFTFSGSGPGPFVMKDQDFRLMPLYRRDGSLIGTLINLLGKQWSDGIIPATSGEHIGIPLHTGETFIKTGDKLYVADVKANVRVVGKLFFGQVPVQSTRGFTDESTGDFLTSSLTTAHLNIHELEKHWEQIKSIDQLAVKPVLTLRFKSLVAM